jgi:pimeloyl-ACP methyl ester carboxylesterase
LTDRLPPGRFRLPDGTTGAIAGRGPPLVLIHGVGLDHRMWQAQVYFFARNRSVVCYDLLGHGESPRISAGTGLAVFVNQLDRLSAALGLERATILGFSFGGLIAQGFALQRSANIDKLVLMSTVYDRTEAERRGVQARLAKARGEGASAIHRAAIERWFSPAFLAGQPEQAQALLHQLEENDEESFLTAYELFASADREFVGKLERIGCPTLILAGENDPGSTPAMAWQMAKEISNSRVSIIGGGRHMMPLEMAQEVNREIARFLES